MSFMSTAPRPHTQPSRDLAGERVHASTRAGSAGTTSRWPCTSSAGRVGSAPSIRATTLARPGSDSSSVGSMPTSASLPATYSAAARSVLDVGLEVSIRISSEQSSTTSSSAVGAGDAGTEVTCSSYHRVGSTGPVAP